MITLNGLTVGQDITWRYEHRGGYGYITMVKAKVIKLNPKTCRIEAIKLYKVGGKTLEKPVQRNVKYENIKQSDKYIKVLVCGGKEI